MPGDIYEHHDRRFRELTVPNAPLERLAGGCRWAEGPVWFADGGFLLFSDIPNNRILRWTEEGVGVFRAQSNFANGNTRDRRGRLVTCEHGTRRLTRTEPDGAVTVLAERHGGGRLNSPNDVVVKSDGSIWFTDPSYGILSDYEGFKAAPEQEGCFVYRLDPESGALEAVARDFVKPNGLAFSPDESVLYVADSGASHDPGAPRHVRALAVVDGGRRLGAGRIVAEVAPGVPDGLRVDRDGHLWVSAGDGVHCYDPDGTPIGRIRVPEPVANLTFGGPRRNRLFITATTSLYSVFVAATGAQTP